MTRFITMLDQRINRVRFLSLILTLSSWWVILPTLSLANFMRSMESVASALGFVRFINVSLTTRIIGALIDRVDIMNILLNQTSFAELIFYGLLSLFCFKLKGYEWVSIISRLCLGLHLVSQMMVLFTLGYALSATNVAWILNIIQGSGWIVLMISLIQLIGILGVTLVLLFKENADGLHDVQ